MIDSPFVKFLVRRVFYMLVALVAITFVLYGVLALTPAETRAQLYMPPWGSRWGSEENILATIISEHGLDDPFLVQYGRWALQLIQGDWGWSPTLREDVFEALILRTPATIELTLYALLLFIPLGLVSGVVAGWRHGRLSDYAFRMVAFVATSIPPFILALVLLAVFYIGLGWFPPGRLSGAFRGMVLSESFKSVTGLLTIDGLLNGRPDITIDALRHLALPVVTLSLAHWATLGRVTRAAMMDELDQEYVTAARGRGISMWLAVWRHAFRNAILPGLNSSAVSAASLVTGVFIIEIMFTYPGVSKVMGLSTSQMWRGPDMSATMGFAVYSTMVVLPLMFVLDVIQAMIDPRVREGVME